MASGVAALLPQDFLFRELASSDTKCRPEPEIAVSARIIPARPPFSSAIQDELNRVTADGAPPLTLFTTLARDERLFKRFFSSGLLDKGHLTLRQREIVIDRTTALCRSEYDWGVHVAIFGSRIGLTQDQAHSTVHGNADDPCWGPDDALLIRLCDALHKTCSIDDSLWEQLHGSFDDGAVLELLLLAGFYRTVSYLTNGLNLPLEPSSVRFPPA